MCPFDSVTVGKFEATEDTRSVGTHSSKSVLVRSWTRELGSIKAKANVSGEANSAYGSTMRSSMGARMVEGRVSGKVYPLVFLDENIEDNS
jgi:hypothetical protein